MSDEVFARVLAATAADTDLPVAPGIEAMNVVGSLLLNGVPALVLPVTASDAMPNFSAETGYTHISPGGTTTWVPNTLQEGDSDVAGLLGRGVIVSARGRYPLPRPKCPNGSTSGTVDFDTVADLGDLRDAGELPHCTDQQFQVLVAAVEASCANVAGDETEEDGDAGDDTKTCPGTLGPTCG